jgi:hypothetical protein
VFLRKDPALGIVVRGEIPGCGEGCYADLSQIFLEYALSCEGCSEQIVASESMSRFGIRLGKHLSANLCRLDDGLSTVDQLSVVYECILNSMNVPYTVDRTPNKIHYKLAYSPLDKAANNAGFSRVLPIARKSFFALCQSVLRMLSSEWFLTRPSEDEIDHPLLEIVIAKG